MGFAVSTAWLPAKSPCRYSAEYPVEDRGTKCHLCRYSEFLRSVTTWPEETPLGRPSRSLLFCRSWVSRAATARMRLALTPATPFARCPLQPYTRYLPVLGFACRAAASLYLWGPKRRRTALARPR